ncbi:calcium channel protein [Metarhizium acridum]|nr:calcium channel protein [Metarhizium acridum]
MKYGDLKKRGGAWTPTGTGFISKEQFPPRLLGELSGVFQMRIYQPEDSIGQILEDVRGDSKSTRHLSIATANFYNDIDIDRLNQRLAKLDVEKIRERRRRFKIFFGEVLVSADPDRDLKNSLRRRARLQRVDEEIRRKVVQGFFDTLYWSRRFKKHMEKKRASRMSVIPQLAIPHIFVDEELGGDLTKNQGRDTAFPEQPRWTQLSVGEGAGQQAPSESPISAFMTQHTSTLLVTLGHLKLLLRVKTPLLGLVLNSTSPNPRLKTCPKQAVVEAQPTQWRRAICLMIPCGWKVSEEVRRYGNPIGDHTALGILGKKESGAISDATDEGNNNT